MCERTPERILNTAEKLFGSHGINAVSLRQIVSEADVNIAAIHYHFGSKDELIREVFTRRLKKINARRLERLQESRDRHGDAPLPIREFLEAFLLPVLETTSPEGEDIHQFFKTIARAHTESNDIVQEVMSKELAPIVARFVEELNRILPDQPREELLMRLALTAGAMVQSVLIGENPHFQKLLGGDRKKNVDSKALLLTFCEKGLIGVVS